MKLIKSNSGVTILELVIAMGLLGVMTIATNSYLFNSFKHNNQIVKKIDIQKSTSLLMNKLEQKIKTADIPVFSNVVREDGKIKSFEINELKARGVTPVKFEYFETDLPEGFEKYGYIISEGIKYDYIKEIRLEEYNKGGKITIIGLGNKYELTSTLYTRNKLNATDITDSIGLNTMLASASSWYKGRNNNNIKKIRITRNYIGNNPWNADVNDEGYIKCYENGNELVISAEGEDMIFTNQDSSNAFGIFTNLESIEGLDLVNTTKTINMSNMFSGCEKLESLDLSSFNTSKVTDMSDMFDGTDIKIITLGFDFHFVGSNHGLDGDDWYLVDRSTSQILEHRNRETTYYRERDSYTYVVRHYLQNANDLNYRQPYEEIKTTSDETITLNNIKGTILLKNNKLVIKLSDETERNISEKINLEGVTGTELATYKAGAVTEVSVFDAVSNGIDLYYERKTFTLTLKYKTQESSAEYKWGQKIPINIEIPNSEVWEGWYYKDGQTLYTENKETIIVMPEMALELIAISS